MGELDFGAGPVVEKITTDRGWDDVDISVEARRRLRRIERSLRVDARAGDGTRPTPHAPTGPVLFTGPSGTGKMIAAGLLGAANGSPVYRVDVSRVVSRYIGETEKNLARLFARAEQGDWILFFDEADAIFGKRTSVRDAHDRYADLTADDLLARIQRHPALVIVATRSRSRLTPAVRQRLRAVIGF